MVVSCKGCWRFRMAAVVFSLLLGSVLLSPGEASAQGEDADPCCDLFGVWVFAPSGTQGSFLPGGRFLWQKRIYLYDCSGPTVTFEESRGVPREMRRVSEHVMEYRDESGNWHRAARRKAAVTVNGRMYRACPPGR